MLFVHAKLETIGIRGCRKTIGSALTANERTVIEVVPEWFRDLFFIFLGVLVMCGLILAVVMMVGIVRAIIADRKKGRGS